MISGFCALLQTVGMGRMQTLSSCDSHFPFYKLFFAEKAL